MSKPEDLLQERLERLESGSPPDVCIQGLPEVEAELLKLTYRLRQLQYPARDDTVVVSQRQTLLALASQEKNTKRIEKPIKHFWANITWPAGAHTPYIRVALAVLAVVTCIFAASVLMGRLRPNRKPFSSSQNLTSVQETIIPDTTAKSQSPAEDLLTATEPAYHVFIPTLIRSLTPQQAALQDIRGLVEVQTETDKWDSVLTVRTLAAGQQIRTGPFSSVSLIFYDGSQIHLGPHTTISIDELDAQTNGGPRVIALTQWIGQSKHDVVPAVAAGSRYEVHTPSATGSAEGTAFRVVVTPARRAHFYVEEGSIAVTSKQTTVLVKAGEMTAVGMNADPEAPAFRIAGEGVVSHIGRPRDEPWIIAGQPFQVYTDTVITGNPQVGDWVEVEGYLREDNTRVAREIILVRRALVNRFTLNGPVQTITGDGWAIAGQSILISTTTQIDSDIEVGVLVHVEGIIKDKGMLQATSISRLAHKEGDRRLPFNFTGVVQMIDAETLYVSGVSLAINESTQVDNDIAVGDLVHVQGWLQEDGIWQAWKIKRVTEQPPTFIFTGFVEHIAPWQVAGIALETRDWTQIDKEINVRDKVRIMGQISNNGTWVALDIEKLDEKAKFNIMLLGALTSVDPWSVNDIPLVVDATTNIMGDLESGMLVHVEIQRLADETWRVLEIRPYKMGWGQGCLMLKTVIVSASEGQIQLTDWPPIELGKDLKVEGTLKPGSVIWLQICFTEDGDIKILHIIVIDQPEPVEITPQPTAPPPVQEDPNAKVTICHKPNSKNPHTITISRSALQTHLDHGDTLGPCP